MVNLSLHLLGRHFYCMSVMHRLDCVVLRTPFHCYFANIAEASAPIHAFLEFLKPVLPTIFFSETMDSGEKVMGPVTMTIINLRKEYGPKVRTSDLLSSATG